MSDAATARWPAHLRDPGQISGFLSTADRSDCAGRLGERDLTVWFFRPPGTFAELWSRFRRAVPGTGGA
jgi:hypothetical protein